MKPSPSKIRICPFNLLDRVCPFFLHLCLCLCGMLVCNAETLTHKDVEHRPLSWCWVFMLCACVPVDDGEIPRSALKFSCLEFFIARARAAEQNKFKALILVLP